MPYFNNFLSDDRMSRRFGHVINGYHFIPGEKSSTTPRAHVHLNDLLIFKSNAIQACINYAKSIIFKIEK